ncbi:MAG: ABC transporter substrate-binding protein [Ottowia sp.]|uniref:ABC transporter substrate-binding protein n=1 Tax=Ottowia sp. TaxID=1898956 RepID=UPI003C76F0E6
MLQTFRASSLKRVAKTLVPVVLAACSAFANAKDVTFVLDFNVNGRHAYYFVALEKGYYKEQGLDVTIVRSGGSADAIKKVAAGQAQIGFADAGSLILSRANDNVPVKLVSVVYQQAPHALFALESSGIKSAQDLVGKRVADSATSSVALMFGAYAKAAGIPKEKVSFVIADGSSLPAILATGRADAIGQYSVGAPILAKVVAPRKLVRLAYKDAGLDFYSNGLIASESMLKDDPETVRKFVAATLKGMKEAFRDPKAAGEILHKAQKQVDADVAEDETRAVAELAVASGMPMGSMTTAKMQATVDLVKNSFQLKREVTAEEMMATGFLPR